MGTSLKNNNITKQTGSSGVALVMAMIMLLLKFTNTRRLSSKNVGNRYPGCRKRCVCFLVLGSKISLGRAGSDFYSIKDAAETRGITVTVPASYFNPVEAVTGWAQL